MELNIRLRNSWKYVGDDRWDWRVFVEDDGSGDLEKVQQVEYILHPTFANPRRLTEDRANQFELKTNGWGTFLIRAFVETVSGTRIRMEHELYLSYDPEEGVTGDDVDPFGLPTTEKPVPDR